MKRSKQGYVLVLALVVILILTSTAALLISNVLRSYQTGSGSFLQETRAMEAEGVIERYYAHLKASEKQNLVPWQKYYEAATEPNHLQTEIEQFKSGLDGFYNDTFSSLLNQKTQRFVKPTCSAQTDGNDIDFIIPVRSELLDNGAVAASVDAVICVKVRFTEAEGDTIYSTEDGSDSELLGTYWEYGGTILSVDYVPDFVLSTGEGGEAA